MPRRLFVSLASKEFALLRLWRSRCERRNAGQDGRAYLLADIGLTREEALRAAAKPFWRT
jgi:uncharacterized protein YjiS (DUF1127 family)